MNTLIYTEIVRQFHHYCHKKVTIFTVLFKNRHAFSFHSQYNARLSNLTYAIDLNAVAIQMLDILCETK